MFIRHRCEVETNVDVPDNTRAWYPCTQCVSTDTKTMANRTHLMAISSSVSKESNRMGSYPTLV
jgi:hypothetical protein